MGICLGYLIFFFILFFPCVFFVMSPGKIWGEFHVQQDAARNSSSEEKKMIQKRKWVFSIVGGIDCQVGLKRVESSSMIDRQDIVFKIRSCTSEVCHTLGGKGDGEHP